MSEGGREHSEAMRRYLGAGIVAALRDEDVTEIYVNDGGGAVWLDRRSAGRVRSAEVLGEGQIRSFLNAVAHAHRVELTRDQPQLQAELPADERFRRARLQGLIPPLSEAPVFVLRKPATRVWSLDEYVRQGILTAAHRAALARAGERRENLLGARGRHPERQDDPGQRGAARDHDAMPAGPRGGARRHPRAAMRGRGPAGPAHDRRGGPGRAGPADAALEPGSDRDRRGAGPGGAATARRLVDRASRPRGDGGRERRCP